MGFPPMPIFRHGRDAHATLWYQNQMAHDEIIPILDFGSQYAQLIARRVREAGVYSELVRPDISVDEIKRMNPKGIVLSGGPSSVYEPNAPRCDPKIFQLGVPILGICYGMQLAESKSLADKSKPPRSREYGRAKLTVSTDDAFLRGLPTRNHRLDEPRRSDRRIAAGFYRAGHHPYVPLRRRASC